MSTDWPNKGVTHFPVWLRNQLISAGLGPVISHTEISCIASYHKHFFKNNKIELISIDVQGKGIGMFNVYPPQTYLLL